MPRIELTSDSVRVELTPLDMVWACHGSLDIPFAHVISANVVDESGWQHLWGKLIGTNAPGLKMAGTFFVDGGLAFLDYGDGKQCIVLQTRDERYKTVIVQPSADQDSETLVADLNTHIQPGAYGT